MSGNDFPISARGSMNSSGCVCLFLSFILGSRVVQLFYKKLGVTEFETLGTCNILREHCSSFRLSYSRLAATFVAGGS